MTSLSVDAKTVSAYFGKAGESLSLHLLKGKQHERDWGTGD